MKGSIGENLKKCRVDAKKSVKEISDLLKSKGFKASEKTIYSWESGNSQPSPDAFLIMCKAYNISDILKTFGYVNSPAHNFHGCSSHFYLYLEYTIKFLTCQ
nr:MAG TPA: helix-turn-helix domain protein [Caudoviricetes sp.]